MSPRTLGPLSPPSWHRPWFRYLAPVEGAEAGPAAPADPADPPAQGDTVDPPADPTDWKSESRKWEQRAKENREKAEKFDQVEASKLSEIEREQKRAVAAETLAASNAAELLQLTFANEHGITKDERALLTATTEEALQAQVNAVLKLRAPSTASAKDAGITGGGKPPAPKPTSMEAAFAAHYAAESN
ncbi:hypothetical protein J2Y69_003074 [Microbacterium resistens]|uniref:DUF4355 domain-containing protein n=1 Tax=Microbacterium resistens TaxID=156977 RepID=A0ABU1SGQ7_9MICO|nr:hypothetical protein [Microbacterium resistens]MDR6868458.1 hypothetical protein [Microbacterium resistens]